MTTNGRALHDLKVSKIDSGQNSQPLEQQARQSQLKKNKYLRTIGPPPTRTSFSPKAKGNRRTGRNPKGES